VLRNGLGEPEEEPTPATSTGPVQGVTLSPGAFRVDDQPSGQGLIESIVGNVAGSFFGS
jgi:hypothetical protein